MACISNDTSFALDEKLSTSVNLDAFKPMVKIAKENGIKRFVYASTSSVYGGNEKFPFSENDFVNTPLQFYAVTKNTNEQMSEAYKNLYGLKFTGLRFFTVYGPWGRPDMALFLFTKNISKIVQIIYGEIDSLILFWKEGLSG